MESLRAGRTRYLVVVSRPASKKAQITSPTASTNTIVGNSDRKCASPTTNNSNSNNQLPSLMSDVVISHTDINENENDDNNRFSISTTSYQIQSNNSSSSVSSQTSANMTTANADISCDIDPQKNSNSNNNYNNNFTQCSNIQDDIQQCDNESTIGSSCSSKSSSNEIEESCLLGIDCNEKTTVGLVLKVLADTAIRLDGDG